MPYKNSNKRKEYNRNHYLRNKEKRLEQARKWQNNNMEKCLLIHREYRQRLRLAALTAYSVGEIKCVCCGETHLEFLCIDHIGGGGAKHRRALGLGKAGGSNFYQWLKNQSYPSGYQVLCHNCNQSYGAYGYCPHGGLE